jgi:hypothetical protein
MKLVPVFTLLAALPLAAQMSDPNAPADTSSATNAAPDASAPAATPPPPPAPSASGFSPAENEPVVQAPPMNPDGTVNPASNMPVVNAPAVTSQPDASASISAGAPPALSPDPFSDPLIVQVVARYQKAWGGDKKEARSLTDDLERWMKDEPNNYLLMAYLGSVYALDSRDAWIGPGKLSYLRKGAAELDEAVKADPSNPAIRLLRAMNYYELPAMLGKHRAAHDDFAYLLEQLQGALPMPYKLNPDTLQAIYYYAGLSDAQFDQKDDARKLWQTGLAIAPASPLGVKIQAELNKPQ